MFGCRGGSLSSMCYFIKISITDKASVCGGHHAMYTPMGLSDVFHKFQLLFHCTIFMRNVWDLRIICQESF